MSTTRSSGSEAGISKRNFGCHGIRESRHRNFVAYGRADHWRFRPYLREATAIEMLLSLYLHSLFPDILLNTKQVNRG
jgi:hypothetical protein